MSWLRYSDDFTEWAEWDHATPEVRWGYVCLVQACSRGKYWDGRLPKPKALAALFAQVDDPESVIATLEELSLVHELQAEFVMFLPRLDEHIPPAHIRNNAELSKQRMRRKRKHDSGDHSLCIASSCPSVTQFVTRNNGTGRVSSSLSSTTANERGS